jgi:hypothetical protein
MVDSDFESNMSRTSNRTRAVMRPPCAKLVSRIRASSCFLLGLHRKHQLSLTESAAFLRDGVLEAWTNTGAAKRHRVICWAAKHAKPVNPLRRLVLLSGRPHLVTSYTHKVDDLLTSVWMLEALRMLSKMHRPGLDAIEAFQRRWEKTSPRQAHLTLQVFFHFLRDVSNAARLSP